MRAMAYSEIPAAERMQGACHPAIRAYVQAMGTVARIGDGLREEADAHQENEQAGEQRDVRAGDHQRVKGAGGAVIFGPAFLQRAESPMRTASIMPVL